MFKENGREKPADSKETANVRDKVIVCWKCGYREVRNSIEFGDTPRCPKCAKGTLHEELDV
jgi:predicted Zn-ribbon and HTH transcriptional regulator